MNRKRLCKVQSIFAKGKLIVNSRLNLTYFRNESCDATLTLT